MTRMIPYAVVMFLGSAVSAWILRREIRRAPEVHAQPEPDLRQVDDGKRSTRLIPPGGCRSATERDRTLFMKLRREEERQRPQGGRN